MKASKNMVRPAAALCAMVVAGVCSVQAAINCVYDRANASLSFVHTGTGGETFGATTLWGTCKITGPDGSSMTTNDFDVLAKTVYFAEASTGQMHTWFNGSHSLFTFCADGAELRFTNGTFNVRASVIESIVSGARDYTYYVGPKATLCFPSSIGDNNSSGNACARTKITLDGGTILDTRAPSQQLSKETLDSTAARTFENEGALIEMLRMNGEIHAVSTTQPSLIRAARLYCYQYRQAESCLFTVDAEAVLRVDAFLTDALRTTQTTNLVAGGFIKRGAGTLELLRGGKLGGSIVVEAGTLRIGPGVRLDVADLYVREGARIVLADGAELIGRKHVYVEPAELAEAAIRLDATVLAGVDKAKTGHTTDSIRNVGTAGGKFRNVNVNNCFNLDDDLFGDRQPAYMANNASAVYLLSGFTNDTNELTAYAVLSHAENAAWTGVCHFFDYDAAMAASGNPRAASAANFHVVMNASKQEYINTWDTSTTARRFNPGSEFSQPYLMTALVYPTTEGNKLNVVYESRYTNGTSRTMPAAVSVNAATNSAVAYREKLNHTMLAVGNRLTSVVSPRSATNINDGKKNFGEFIAFFRHLSDTEQNRVREYLLWKWFDVKPEDGTLPLRIEVEDGARATAVLNGIDVVEKTGTGTLALPGVSTVAAEKLDVQAGGVEFAPSVIGRKAALWIDAADPNAVATDADGNVVEIRNKGTCGGVFASRNAATSKVRKEILRGTAQPMLEWPAGAGEGCVFDNMAYTFDGDATNGMHTVFAVVARGDANGDIGERNWRCAFSLGPAPSEITAAEPRQILRIAATEQGMANKPYSLTLGGSATAQLATFTPDGWDEAARRGPALVRLETGMTGEGLAALECAAENGSHKMTRLYSSSRILPQDRRFGMARLGSRIYGNLAVDHVWYGAVGEILVFNCELTFDEKAAVTDYLRARWFTGEASAAPSILAGETLSAGEPKDLSMAAGAKLVYSGSTGAVADFRTAAGALVEIVAEPTGSEATVLTYVTGDLQGMSLATPGSWRLRKTATGLDLIKSGTLLIIR